MKVLAYAAIAAALAMPASLSARQGQETIVVSPAPTVQQWASTVGARLSDNLDRLPFTPEGVVSVRFRCSEAGRPSAIAIAQGSGSRDLDDVAIRAVRNLKGMHPLPQGITEDQLYEATIIVAATRIEADRMAREFQLARADRDRDGSVLAFAVVTTSSAASL